MQNYNAASRPLLSNYATSDVNITQTANMQMHDQSADESYFKQRHVAAMTNDLKEFSVKPPSHEVSIRPSDANLIPSTDGSKPNIEIKLVSYPDKKVIASKIKGLDDHRVKICSTMIDINPEDLDKNILKHDVSIAKLNQKGQLDHRQLDDDQKALLKAWYCTVFYPSSHCSTLSLAVFRHQDIETVPQIRTVLSRPNTLDNLSCNTWNLKGPPGVALAIYDEQPKIHGYKTVNFKASHQLKLMDLQEYQNSRDANKNMCILSVNSVCTSTLRCNYDAAIRALEPEDVEDAAVLIETPPIRPAKFQTTTSKFCVLPINQDTYQQALVIIRFEPIE